MPGLVVVSHPEIAGGGVPAGQRLLGELDLTFTAESAAELARESGGGDEPRPQVDPGNLHNFDRDPGQVASSWRRLLEPAEIDEIESVTHAVRADLDASRYDLRPS